MRVALVHISSEAWITRVETVEPGSSLQLTRSIDEARRELAREGYSEVCGVQSEAAQLLVFVEAQMNVSTPMILIERVKAELAHLSAMHARVDAEIGKSSS